MDGHDLLHALQGATEFETVGDTPAHERPARRSAGPLDLSDCITQVTAGNRKMPVLKGMTTTACERDCLYCPFRAGRTAMRRVTPTPDDYAQGFLALYKAGAVEGLFLSSGVIRGGVHSQDSIIDTATILREKYGFRGYMHLKIMPGAERDQVQRTMELADRVSVNLSEAPSADRLAKIAPGKGFSDELLTRLQWVEDLRRDSGGQLAPSSTTEFVVGPAGESDVELLSTSQQLYRHLKLSRVYFSAFHPVLDTPLENVAPTIDTRRIRLYQASFLLRDYGFDVELPFTQEGHLPLDTDPKLAWAEVHLRHTPVEVNTASPEDLLRVPGIGSQGAARIVRARRQSTLRTLQDLRALGVRNVQRVAPYVLLDGVQPPQQPRLF